MIILLKSSIECMINAGAIPDNFNTSIIKPLIKDTKLPNTDLNYLRPISVPDVFANVFERVILFEINKQHTDHEKQFGFKPNSSCSHAVFVLRQILKMCKSKNKTAFMCP